MPDGRDSLREAVTGIWCAVLGADHAEEDADFFLSGGTSALAVEAAISLRALVGTDLELDLLYQQPKFGGLLSLLTDPKPERRERPLTPAEERLWFAERLHPGTPRYNIAALYRFDGRIDVPRLRAALDALVTRHDSLRRGFEGAGRAVTADQVSVSCRWLDAVGLPEDTVRKLIDEQARLPFDLARPPLLRAMAVDRGGEGDLLLLTVHHLVCDGASLAILEDDLGRLYREGASAAPTEATAEVSTLLLGEAESRAYWRSALDGCPRGIALPHDKPRPALLDGTGDVHALECAEDLVADMAALAEQERLSPFMTWIVAYAAGLVAQTGERDIVLGIAASSRTADERGEIGMFVNPVPLRLRIPQGVTPRELARQVRRSTVEALAHRGVPFQTLVEDLGPGGDPGRAPLIQAGLTYLEAGDCVLRLDSQEAARELLPTGTSKYELLWSVTKQAGRVLTEFEYLDDLFSAERAATVHSELIAAARAAFARPDAPLRVAEAPAAQQWRPLPELIREQVAQRPDAPALRHNDVELTYQELDQRAVAIASGLRAAGLDRGSVVAVPMPRGIDSICAYVGIFYAGCAYLPLDPEQPAERIDTALHGIADAALVTGTPPVLPAGLAVLHVETLLQAQTDPAVPVPVIGEDPAYLISTSGSTGRPKTVVVPHRGISRLVPDAEGIAYLGEDRVSHLCNPAFDASMLEIWGALGSGAVLVVGDKADALSPARLRTFLEDNDISVVGLPTALLHSVIDFAPDAFRDLRLLIFGGEKADEQRLAKLMANEPPECVVNVYGPTENTTVSTLQEVTREALEPGPLPIGRAITGSTAYALDADGGLVPVGGEGELYVGGAGLALGYHGNPALTAAAFVPDPFGKQAGGRLYRTGDRVRPQADGTFLFVGRNDDQVKVRGFRVELGEIEHELRALPGVIDAVVFARATADSVELLACVTGEEIMADSAGLAQGLRDRLPAYMIPAIVCTEPFPLNANGKVDRAALLASLPAQTPGEPVEPVEMDLEDPLTEAISVLWCESLGTAAARPDENFVAKGGHSIKALKLLARVDETFGVAVELADFMAEPTLRGLVAAVARESN